MPQLCKLKSMRSSTQRALFALLCMALLLGASACKSSSKQPISPATEASSGTLKPTNIVLITLDTVRADHLHCYGYKKIKTPNIDRLAASGVQFDKAVAQAPLTLPSHASMFTGTNPNVHHVRDTGGFILQPSSVTLARILQKHGWNTAAFVSSFVFMNTVGFNQGFSTYDDRLEDNQGHDAPTRSANVTVDHAVDWLNRSSTQPFFLWVHLYDAHQPYTPPPIEFQRQYPGDIYDAEIAYMDQQIGRLLNAVKEKSPASNTLVVLLSDHGESLGDHGEYQHGIFLYDSTIRIAWLMAGPGIPAGVHVEQQARTIDLLPTVLDLLGGKASSAVQGTSLVPAFHGKPVATEYSYEETLYPRFIMNWSALRGIHTADWMYVHAPKPELYDLRSDPGELHNVIDAHPKEYRELEKQLKLLSQAGSSEKVVSKQMDQYTMHWLRSLGYLGGSVTQELSLNDSGADPKDRVDILKLVHIAKDSPPGAVSPKRRVELFKEALEKDPTNPSLYYDLGDVYEKTGQADASLQLCLEAIHHGVKGEMIQSRLGQLYLAKHDAKDAITYYRQALQLDPQDAEAQNNLATAYLDSGQLADADREFHQELATKPYAPAYTGLGLAAVTGHDLAAARANFERALQTDPDYVPAELNLGVLCMQTGDAPCARTAFHAFLEKAPPAQYKETIPRVQYALRTVLAEKR